MDQADWTLAVEASFPDTIPPPSGCEGTLFFPITQGETPFRFFRFIAVTYHLHGAVLQFIAPTGKSVGPFCERKYRLAIHGLGG